MTTWELTAGKVETIRLGPDDIDNVYRGNNGSYLSITLHDNRTFHAHRAHIPQCTNDGKFRRVSLNKALRDKMPVWADVNLEDRDVLQVYIGAEPEVTLETVQDALQDAPVRVAYDKDSPIIGVAHAALGSDRWFWFVTTVKFAARGKDVLDFLPAVEIMYGILATCHAAVGNTIEDLKRNYAEVVQADVNAGTSLLPSMDRDGNTWTPMSVVESVRAVGSCLQWVPEESKDAFLEEAVGDILAYAEL